MQCLPFRLKGPRLKWVLRVVLIIAAVALWAAVLPGGGSGCARMKSAPQKPEEGFLPRSGEEAVPHQEDAEEQILTLTYLGQSSFLVEAAGRLILMDPFDPGFGLGRIAVEADLVTISHEHLDHNYAAGGGRQARVVRGLTPQGDWSGEVLEDSGLYLYTVPAYHDRNGGVWLGKNSIFVIETAGLRLAHLGDLGHPLGEREKGLLGRVDVLLVPAGGEYTLTPAEALRVIEETAPRVAIPMHYRSRKNPDPALGSLEDFLDLQPSFPIRYPGGPVIFTPGSIPASTEIWVLEPILP